MRTKRGDGLRSVTSATLNVESWGDNSRLCSFLFGKTNYDGINALLFDKNIGSAADYLHDVKFKFIIDTLGSIKELIDIDSAKIKFKENLRSTYMLMADVTPETAEWVLKLMASSFENDEVFLASHFPEFTAFFGLYNDTLAVDSVYRSKTTSINPLNQKPLVFDETKGIDKIDEVTANIVVISALSKRESKLSNFTIDNLPISESDSIAIIQVDSKIEYSYDVTHKKIRNVFSRKLIQVDSAFQEQTFRIEQLN